jgi:hypothetical protein
MEHSGSWESDNLLAGHQILSVLLNPNLCAMITWPSNYRGI